MKYYYTPHTHGKGMAFAGASTSASAIHFQPSDTEQTEQNDDVGDSEKV